MVVHLPIRVSDAASPLCDAIRMARIHPLVDLSLDPLIQCPLLLPSPMPQTTDQALSDDAVFSPIDEILYGRIEISCFSKPNCRTGSS